MTPRDEPARRPGKGPEPKVALPEDWWSRLNDLCRAKWHHDEGGTTSTFDLYSFTKVTRGTFDTARKSGEMTQRTFGQLAANVGYDRSEDLLRLLGPAAAEPESPATVAKKQIKASQDKAETLIRANQKKEGIALLEEALALAERNDLASEEVELLVTLALLSSSRRGPGQRRVYMDRARKKLSAVIEPAGRVHYYRGLAAACQEDRDAAGEESALRAALEATTKDLVACVVRSDLVILLCQQGRHSEAADFIAACDKYAREHKTDEEGEIMQAVMSAGVLFDLKAGDEESAIARIGELEGVASTEHQAERIGGQLANMANNASAMGSYRAALAAAESSVRLARRCPRTDLLVGSMYTVAVVAFHSGDHKAAKLKAEALLGICNAPEHTVIKQAANHLLAEIVRGGGDAESAVNYATHALASSQGRPEDAAITKQAIARALSDNGQTEEALEHALQAYELMLAAEPPAFVRADALLQIISYASVLGRSAETDRALTMLNALNDDGLKPSEKWRPLTDVRERAPKLAEMNGTLRARIVGVGNWDWDDVRRETASLPSQHDANARVVAPLLTAWEEIPRQYPGSAATAYDFWGRGSFARIVANTQAFNDAFNVTLEVRTLEDLKRATRLWCLYADLLILVWKGPTQDGMALDVIPEALCDAAGCGAGYILSAEKGKDDKPRFFGMTHSSLLPPDVMQFLATEARPLLAAGRLIVVPATGVGCVHPGHGPLEQLLAESANAVAGVRGSDNAADAPIGMMAYSPDAPLEWIADLVESQTPELRRLRLLLMKRTRELRPHDSGVAASRELTLELQDGLKTLESRQRALARKKGHAASTETVGGTVCRFNRDGTRLQPPRGTENSPFAPVLTFQNFGFKWAVGAPTYDPPGRFEPGNESVIGPWLAPPTVGWSILTVKRADD